jgi:hypothetical protein
MIKRSFKILSVIAIMWTVSLLTIIREYKSGTLLVLSDGELYEKALKSFRRKYVDVNTTYNESGFESKYKLYK